MNRFTRRGLLTAFLIATSLHVIVGAQGAGQNINVVTGSGDQFTGDLFRQKQAEPVIGISSVNPADMMVAYVDYRTVDQIADQAVGSVPPAQGFVAKLLDFVKAPWRLGRGEVVPQALKTAAFANIGLSFSYNGGKTWASGLLPGRYAAVPSDIPFGDDAHRLDEFEAMSDPVLATTPDRFLLGGIAFNSPAANCAGCVPGKSVGFVARFRDTNDPSLKQKIVLEGATFLLETTAGEKFVDKPSVAAGPDGHVYAAFVVFDQQDPAKLSSKILFFRSSDYGLTFEGPIVVSQPLTRNQAPWIVVDPQNESIVYIGWRVFSAQTGGWTNAIVGKKSTNGGASFAPSIPYPVALLLKAFDVPQGNLSGPNPTLPSPRSNAYPSATIDGNGAIHVAIQEYVYPPNHPIAALRGRPLAPFVSPTLGVPRITTTTSYNGGSLWTLRKAADLGTAPTPAGSQFMPVLTAAGEPGPSCGGKTGPRSRVMLMFYDARASGVGATAGTLGYVLGGDKQFDVRIAQASACSSNGLNFSPSEQVSQYTRSAEAPFDIITKNSITTGGTTTSYSAVNRAYPTSCGGNCAFSGDYNHAIPRVPYFKTTNGQWKPTTAVNDPDDRERLPAPVVQVVFADGRHIDFPTMGSRDPNQPLPANTSEIDLLPWNVYQEPGTGLAPCLNPGSRDLNVFTAEYTPGGLFASVPATFLNSSIPRSYPLYVENRTPNTKYYRVTIEPNADASFDYTDFDGPATPGNPKPNFGEPYARVTGVTIGPISSVTGSIIVGPGVTTPILITVEETGPPVTGVDPVTNLPTTRGGDLISPPAGAKTSVTFFSSGNDESLTETHQPVVYPTPIVTKPFEHLIPQGGFLSLPRSPAAIPSPTPFSPNPFSPNPFSPNPFSPNPFSPNPFSPNPFSPNPFSPNPFSPNPFSPNPFSPNAADPDVEVYDVTDISYVVRNAGDQAAAFNAIADVLTSAPQNHVFQLLINRAVPTPVLIRDANGDCRAADSWQPVPLSTIGNPFSPNPFSPNPFSPNPFSPNPFSPNPFSPNPFPSEFSNATFYVKPADASGVQTLVNNSQGFVGEPSEDITVVTIRDFLLVQPIPGNPATQPITPNNVVIEVEGQIPEQPVQGGGFEDDPPAAGTQVPNHLAFTVQPTNSSAGTLLPPVVVTVNDAFGNPISGNSSPVFPVTLAIGNNPSGGLLSGTLTKNTVNGVATFDNLTINTAGVGYTLVASSSGLASASSAPFNIISGPSQLAFVVQPTSSPANLTIAPPIQVAIQDASGNPTTSSAPIQLDIFPNPGNAVLSGLTTKDAVNGVATFSNLSITPAGTGYTLRAQSAGLSSATSLPFNIVAPPPTALDSVLNTDFVSAGLGSMRGGNGTGTITVTGVSGTVTRALLFWNGPSDSSDPAANATVTFNGVSGTGANSGFASSNCWAFANTQSYRADVTALVTGNGTYSLSNFRKAGPPVVDMNGVSLIVFFNDNDPENNRDVYLLSTNDSNQPLLPFDAANWNSVIPGVQYASGVGVLQLHVGDGQGFGDGGIVLNGTTVVPPGPNFQGNTVPPNVGDPIPLGSGTGGLWDIKSWDIPPELLIAGPNTLTLTSATAGDCLSLVVMLVSVPHVAPAQ